MSDDLGRYRSAAGWEPKDPYKKLREQVRKRQAMEPESSDSMLEMRAASVSITRGSQRSKHSPELFGALWREGEVAVLFGETGSGKSVLAVQLAEAIASGAQASLRAASTSIRTQHSAIRTRRVVFFDFERSERQFAERYSAPSSIPGKLPVKCRFKFARAQIEWDGEIPAAFKNDADAFLRHSIFHKIAESGARVVIFDNISWLVRDPSRSSAYARLMKTLKLWAAAYDLSILLLVPSKIRSFRDPLSALRNQNNRPLGLNDIAGGRCIADLADTVFAIAASRFAPDIRYIKHLKSNSSPASDPHPALRDPHSPKVFTYRIERVDSPHFDRPHPNRRASQALIPPSAIRAPQSEGPFLCLSYLGPSNESDHLRDYARESQLAEQHERQQLRQSKNVAGILMSREYKRYLER